MPKGDSISAIRHCSSQPEYFLQDTVGNPKWHISPNRPRCYRSDRTWAQSNWKSLVGEKGVVRRVVNCCTADFPSHPNHTCTEPCPPDKLWRRRSLKYLLLRRRNVA